LVGIVIRVSSRGVNRASRCGSGCGSGKMDENGG
jgi:hypothetical protein